MRARRVWGGLFALVFILVAWLAFTPKPPGTSISNGDKIGHGLAFATLALLAALAARPQAQREQRRRQLWQRAGALFVWGVVIELVQSQLPTRSAELADIVADSVGIGLGLLLALPALRRDRQRQRQSQRD